MFRNKLNLRNVVAIAICLAVTTMFSGFDKERGDLDGDKTPNVKFVSRIDYYDNDSLLTINEFQYDAQNRLTKIISTDEYGGKFASTIAYPSANTVTISGYMVDGDSITYTLNSDGSIASGFGTTYTYVNGYLQKIASILDMSTTFTWENGNMKTSVMYFFSSPPHTIEYEYGTVQNKPISLGFQHNILESAAMPRGLFGKSNKNLPSKIKERGIWNKENTFRYETDSNSYVTKVFRTEHGDSITNLEERLYMVISYK